MFTHRGNPLRLYWSQLSQQVTLQKEFLWKHIPSIGHHVDGQIVSEEREQSGSLSMTTAVSSPSDGLSLTEVPASCSKQLIDKAVKASEKCRIQHWKKYDLQECFRRCISACDFIQKPSNLKALARIEALQTGLPLYVLEKRIDEQLQGLRRAMICELFKKCASSVEKNVLVKAQEISEAHTPTIGFPAQKIRRGSVLGIIYGSSSRSFTTSPVHWCLTDIFSGLMNSQPILLTPCEHAPLTVLYISILLQRAPLKTIDEIFNREEKVKEKGEYAIPLGSVNILHMKDVHLVDASEKNTKVKFPDSLLQSMVTSHDLVSHFLLPSFIVRKHTARSLLSLTSPKETAVEPMSFRGKSMSYSCSDYFFDLADESFPKRRICRSRQLLGKGFHRDLQEPSHTSVPQWEKLS